MVILREVGVDIQSLALNGKDEYELQYFVGELVDRLKDSTLGLKAI